MDFAASSNMPKNLSQIERIYHFGRPHEKTPKIVAIFCKKNLNVIFLRIIYNNINKSTRMDKVR